MGTRPNGARGLSPGKWEPRDAPRVESEGLGMPAQFGVCNVCKKAIPMGTKYYRCSVSTCNSGRWKLTFCSVRCWDIHLPEARHRDAGAIEEMARPSGPR
jgi:hypothetical protein